MQFLRTKLIIARVGHGWFDCILLGAGCYQRIRGEQDPELTPAAVCRFQPDPESIFLH